MKILGPIDIASDGTRYVPVPCRGTVARIYGTYETNAVEPGDTIIASRDTTAVNTLTAVATAGLVREEGVPDATNKGLIFDPESTTAVNRVIKLVANGAAGISTVFIEYDDSAYVEQPPLEA